MNPLPLFALIIALSMTVLGQASVQAQVLVYKLDISQGDGINYYTYEGGYLVAPLLGGTSSFLLTSSDHGRTYVEAPDSGNLFLAVNDDSKKAVISATTGTGTASGALLAFGEINERIHIKGKTNDIRVRVAKTMKGTLLSSNDESELTDPPANGSLGVAGISVLRLSLDEDATSDANEAGLSVDKTIEQLKLILEREGYSNADDDEEEPEVPNTAEPTPTANSSANRE